ncbi:hybrid sensor histidine kinase/response regulator, partial [Thermodesulfatator atlanticus]
MAKFITFFQRIKLLIILLFRPDERYRLTRSFALMMLPVTFLAGIFICFAVPASYYYISKQEKKEQAKLHASYLASIFRHTIESNPLNWQDQIKEQLKITNIQYVIFYDSQGRVIEKIGKISHDFSSKFFVISVRYPIKFGKELYGFVEVGLSSNNMLANIFQLLIFSLVLGTLEGLALWLIPIFYIWSAEEKINKSQEELLLEREKLKASETKYRTLFEFAPDGHVITTADGKIISCNNAFRQLVGLDKDENPDSIQEFYVDLNEREKILDELFGVGEVRNREVLFRRKDGKEIPVLVSQRLIGISALQYDIPVEYQEAILVFAVIRDISKLKEMERQLLQAQKMESIGLLAGGIAHDFNNILAAISGYNELLKNNLKDPKLLRYTEIIEKSTKRAADLVSNLLAFARAGKYQVEPLNLNDIVDEVISFLKHSLDKKIVLRKEISAKLPIIMADSSQINQVLLNLCLNARDAILSQGGGQIIIRTRTTIFDNTHIFITGDKAPPGEYVVLEVEDTGPGIPHDIIDKIFEPFFTTKPVGEGSGLGLSVVYGIVRNHGGFVDVSSRPGKTKFTIFFPKAEQINKAKQDIVSSFTAKELNGDATVLIVDDEDEVRELTRVVLEEHGYCVFEAKDGQEALTILQTKNGKIDLVLLDLIMPGVDGKETFYSLKEIAPRVKVILLSGYVADKSVQKLLSEGADAFLSKPYRIQDLLILIHQV